MIVVVGRLGVLMLLVWCVVWKGFIKIFMVLCLIVLKLLKFGIVEMW